MESIIIGKYRIEKFEKASESPPESALIRANHIWMVVDSGPDEGEGMEVSEKVFEKVLEKFYEETF